MNLNLALIGHPIGHTMSPYIHENLARLAGAELNYKVFDIADIKENMPQLKSFDGFNVTIPHKEAIIPFLDRLDEKAAAFGSVNTVKNENGISTGYTTDGTGAIKAIEMAMGSEGFPENILILGNGGAARAVAFEISYARNETDITLVCRENSYEKAKLIKEQINSPRISIISYDELEHGNKEYGLLINATSVGMYPNTGFSPVSENTVSRCGGVFDIVYNPADTLLISMAKKLGKRVIYGIDMLVYQAVYAHEIWYNKRFDENNIKELCESAKLETARLFVPENIVLCGFMGSGKTAVGTRFAEITGKRFIDLDVYIEEKAGISISDIFKEYGEGYFRDLESKAAEEISQMENIVAASGGGTFLRQENAEFFKSKGFKIIFLDVSPIALKKRLETDTKRPLLQVEKRDEVFDRLYASRYELYKSVSDISLETDEPVEETARALCKLLKKE